MHVAPRAHYMLGTGTGPSRVKYCCWDSPRTLEATDWGLGLALSSADKLGGWSEASEGSHWRGGVAPEPVNSLERRRHRRFQRFSTVPLPCPSCQGEAEHSSSSSFSDPFMSGLRRTHPVSSQWQVRQGVPPHIAALFPATAAAAAAMRSPAGLRTLPPQEQLFCQQQQQQQQRRRRRRPSAWSPPPQQPIAALPPGVHPSSGGGSSSGSPRPPKVQRLDPSASRPAEEEEGAGLEYFWFSKTMQVAPPLSPEHQWSQQVWLQQQQQQLAQAPRPAVAAVAATPPQAVAVTVLSGIQYLLREPDEEAGQQLLPKQAMLPPPPPSRKRKLELPEGWTESDAPPPPPPPLPPPPGRQPEPPHAAAAAPATPVAAAVAEREEVSPPSLPPPPPPPEKQPEPPHAAAAAPATPAAAALAASEEMPPPPPPPPLPLPLPSLAEPEPPAAAELEAGTAAAATQVEPEGPPELAASMVPESVELEGEQGALGMHAEPVPEAAPTAGEALPPLPPAAVAAGASSSPLKAAAAAAAAAVQMEVAPAMGTPPRQAAQEPAAAVPEPAAAYVAAYLTRLAPGPQRRCALQLLERLDAAPGCWLGPGALTDWARAQGFGREYLRKALLVLQEAAVLELQQLPASSAPGTPLAATWQLLPAGAGLALTEGVVQAVAETAGTVATAGSPQAASEEQEDMAAAVERPALLEAASEAANQAAAAGAQVAAVAAAAAALSPPPALVVQWIRAARPPLDATLRLLRPAAAAMLRSLQARTMAAPGGQQLSAELEAAAWDHVEAVAAAAGMRPSGKDLGLCSRQLLLECGLLECCSTSPTARRWWCIPASKAAAAAAAVSEVLGTGAAAVPPVQTLPPQPQPSSSRPSAGAAGVAEGEDVEVAAEGAEVEGGASGADASSSDPSAMLSHGEQAEGEEQEEHEADGDEDAVLRDNAAGGAHLGWPLPITNQLLRTMHALPASAQQLQRIQRWAAASLQALQAPATVLTTAELEEAAALAAGEQNIKPSFRQSAFINARLALVKLGLLHSRWERYPTKSWSIPAGAAAAAAAVVAQAAAAGALRAGEPPAAPAAAARVLAVATPAAILEEGGGSAVASAHRQAQQRSSPLPGTLSGLASAALPVASLGAMPHVPNSAATAAGTGGPIAAAAAAAAAAAGTAVSMDSPAPLLPSPESPGEEQAALLDPAGADSVQLLQLADRLLDLAGWAGVEAVQAAAFGEAFLALPPTKRLFQYRQLFVAAGKQDASRVRSLVDLAQRASQDSAVGLAASGGSRS